LPFLPPTLPFLAVFATHNAKRQAADPGKAASFQDSRGGRHRHTIKKRQKRQW
jgi:hypothetical protein